MVFPFGKPKHLHTKAKEDYLTTCILTMASSLWLYYKVDYLILLRKRECSLKALALLLVVYDSVVLCFFCTLDHTTPPFIGIRRALNYLLILFPHNDSYNYSLYIAGDAFASSCLIIYKYYSL
jgi:hypothetical protein